MIKIKKVLSEIGWKNDIPIVYGKDPFGRSCYYSNHKIAIDVDKKIKNRYTFFHHILHECLHHFLLKFTDGVQARIGRKKKRKDQNETRNLAW